MDLVSARKRGKFWQYRFEAASVKSVQARLGHQNVTTTLQTYVHDTPATEADAVSIFERHGVGLGHTLRRRGQFVVSGHVFTSFHLFSGYVLLQSHSNACPVQNQCSCGWC